MKKLIAITSLVTAAAMTSTAFAWDVDTSTGLPTDPTTTETVSTIPSEAVEVSADTIYNYTPATGTVKFDLSSGNDIKLVGSKNNSGTGNSSDRYIIGGISGTGDVWFAQGQWQLGSVDNLTTTGTLYLQGGQLQITANNGTWAGNVVLGSSTFSENYSGASALSNSALRVDKTFTFSGTTTLVEDAEISFSDQDDKTLTLNTLVSNGKNLSTSTFGNFNSATLKVNDISGFKGTINLVDKVTLALTATNGSTSTQLNYDYVTGTGTLHITGDGNTSNVTTSNIEEIAVTLSEDFTGTLKLTNTQLDLSVEIDGSPDNNGAPSNLGKATTINLDNAALSFRKQSSGTDFDKNIKVDAGKNGYLRVWQLDNGVTFTGEVSGDGTLSSIDGGPVTFKNTVDIGAYTNTKGNSTFSGATTIGTLTVSAGTVKLAGTTTEITTATVASNAKLSIATTGVKVTGEAGITFNSGAKLVLDNALLAKLNEGAALNIIIGTINFGDQALSSINLTNFTTNYIEYGDGFTEAIKNQLAWGYNNGTLTLSGVPEPSMFGLLAGLGALALVGARRRRKTK